MLRLGWIGCGRTARTDLVPCLDPALWVEAVADPDPGAAAAMAAALGGARVVADPLALAASRSFDLVVIAADPETTRKAARAALQARQPLHIAGQPGASAADAAALAGMARQFGSRVTLGLAHRLRPEILRLRDLAAEGVIGPLTSVSGRLLRQGGAGQLAEAAFAMADLVPWLIDERPGPLSVQRAGTLVQAGFVTATGILGHILAGTTLRPEPAAEEMVLTGTHGRLTLAPDRRILLEAAPPAPDRQIWRAPGSDPTGQRAVFAALVAGGAGLPGLEDGMRAMGRLDRMLEPALP